MIMMSGETPGRDMVCVCCFVPDPASSWASEGRSNAAAGHWQLFHLHAAGPGSLTWLHREAVTL